MLLHAEPIHIDKAEAIAAVTDAAFLVNDPGSSDHGRKIVHCFIGSMGADWDLEAVIDAIEQSTDRAWVGNIFDHELAVLVDGRIRNFAVKAPSAGVREAIG